MSRTTLRRRPRTELLRKCIAKPDTDDDNTRQLVTPCRHGPAVLHGMASRRGQTLLGPVEVARLLCDCLAQSHISETARNAVLAVFPAALSLRYGLGGTGDHWEGDSAKPARTPKGVTYPVPCREGTHRKRRPTRPFPCTVLAFW